MLKREGNQERCENTHVAVGIGIDIRHYLQDTRCRIVCVASPTNLS